MVRCKEFYEKWDRCGNFCEKHPKTADKIGKYLALIEEAETKCGKDVSSPIGDISEWSLRPVIYEKNAEIRVDAIRKTALLKKKKEKEYGKNSPKARVTQSEVKKVIRDIKKVEEKEKIDAPKPTTGKYRCIVIDPPWPVKKIERKCRPKQGKYLDYPTMSLEEIEAIPIVDLADERGCHVYLWVIQKYLPVGIKLFETWNVKYQCVMTWIKPTGMTPFSWMYNTEHVLFGRIGNLPLNQNGIKLSFEAPSVQHSKKPDIFYNMVRKASPDPRIDMFARENKDGFDAWGLDVHDEK